MDTVDLSYLQSLAAVAQSFVFFGLGIYISMPAIVIRDLFNKTDSEFSITATEASWYGKYFGRVFYDGFNKNITLCRR